jgi:hypothetical protein
MANIMGILGGVGQGISAGVQDLERMDEAKNRKEEAQFRKELQQRERERLAEEKRLGEAVKGIKRSREGFTPEQAAANTQAGFTNLPTRDDEGRLVYGATETAIPRSEAELLKEEAALYAASPDIRNRTLGRQLQGEARVLETQDKIKSVQSKYEEARKLLNTDPAKFQETYPALFNADKFGGPETAGMIMAPMSTSKGTVYNIMNPQGKTVAQLPMDKRSLGQALDAMYYSELANVDTKYADLVMKNERLGLERAGLGLKQQANESEAEYRRRMASVYEGREGREDKIFTAQEKGGMFSRPPERFSPLGINDEGTRMLGVRGGGMAELPIPAGYSEGAFPKIAKKGTKPVPAKIMTDQEGNTVAYNADGRPMYNIVGGGLEVPLGVTSSDYNRMVKESRTAKIPMEVGSVDGKPVIAYKGKDGNYYSTLDEAKKAKAK